jgi:hypothetical protein
MNRPDIARITDFNTTPDRQRGNPATDECDAAWSEKPGQFACAGTCQSSSPVSKKSHD